MLDELHARVEGRVIGPDDEDYDRARAVFYGGFEGVKPSVIVRAARPGDVSTVVTFARDRGVELAVRSGGHSPAGHGTTDGGIVLDLGELKGLEIDADRRTAWAETGLTALEVSTAAAKHDLAIGFGDTGSVGIGGITLGGGVGYLVRKQGLTIDSLLAAEIVTADGETHLVDEDHEPDLFWAIRGGGGNLGVATRFRYRLHELPGIVGGMLILPASPEVIAGFMAEAEGAPEELSAIANVMVAPPLPFLPPDAAGSLVLMSLMCFAGDAEAGERALAPFRSLATPIVDQLRPMPYPEIYPPEDDSYHPTAAGRTMFLDRVDLGTAETIVERLQASDAVVRVTQLRTLGGAMARVPAEATAFAHRSSRIMANVAAFYEGEADRPAKQAWVDGSAEALQQGDEGAYVGFLVEEGEERVRAAYPGSTWDRLAEVKRRYDPTNVFRRNQNVPPAA